MLTSNILYGGVAQLARAFGSYPECHLFESDRRYQMNGNFDRKLSFFFFAKTAHDSGFSRLTAKKSKAQRSIFAVVFSSKLPFSSQIARLETELSLNYRAIVELYSYRYFIG